jgi:hypothetical protein
MREMGELLLMSFWSGGRLVSLMMQVWLSFDCQSEKRGMALTGRAILLIHFLACIYDIMENE